MVHAARYLVDERKPMADAWQAFWHEGQQIRRTTRGDTAKVVERQQELANRLKEEVDVGDRRGAISLRTRHALIEEKAHAVLRNSRRGGTG